MHPAPDVPPLPFSDRVQDIRSRDLQAEFSRLDSKCALESDAVTWPVAKLALCELRLPTAHGSCPMNTRRIAKSAHARCTDKSKQRLPEAVPTPLATVSPALCFHSLRGGFFCVAGLHDSVLRTVRLRGPLR